MQLTAMERSSQMLISTSTLMMYAYHHLSYFIYEVSQYIVLGMVCFNLVSLTKTYPDQIFGLDMIWSLIRLQLAKNLN